MPELKTYALICPGCGSALKIGESVDSFGCTYCGASVRVERGDGIVSLRLITNAISNVQRGTDRTAAELALVRLRTRELPNIAARIASLGPCPPAPSPDAENVAMEQAERRRHFSIKTSLFLMVGAALLAALIGGRWGAVAFLVMALGILVWSVDAATQHGKDFKAYVAELREMTRIRLAKEWEARAAWEAEHKALESERTVIREQIAANEATVK